MMWHLINIRVRRSVTVVVCIGVLLVTLTAAKFYLSELVYPKTSGIPGLLALENVDYLFMGSSLTRQSYNIKMIEDEYYTSAFACSYNGMDTVFAGKVLKYLLGHSKVRIGTLVMEAYPYKLFSPPSSLEDIRLFNASSAELKIEFLRDMYNSEHNLKKLYTLLVLSGNEDIVGAPFTYKILEKMSYRGTYVGKVMPGEYKLVPGKERAEVPHTFQGQYDSYLDLIELCRENNIKLIFIEPFVPYYFQNGEKYTAGKEVLTRLLAEKGAVFISNKMIQMDNKDPSLFSGGIHLSGKGRDLWSREIMKRIGPVFDFYKPPVSGIHR